MNKKLKGLIFDADGTLIDSMSYWMKLTPRYLESKGKKSTKELEMKIFSMSLEHGVEFLKSEFNLEESQDEIKNELLSIIFDFYNKEIPLKPGVFEFLSKMKKLGIPMAVATSGNENLLNAAFSRLGCSDFFRKIVTCGQLNTDKSKPDIYLHLTDFFNAKPEEIVVFEDALLPIQTVKNAGFNVVAVHDESSSKNQSEIQKTADIFIQDFNSPELTQFFTNFLTDFIEKSIVEERK